ncbi:MAG TPA: OmpA family protein [Nevskiaceae bacterium]|nr:OmpA family protein [Nevskiaceae bacterium]
MKQGRALGVGLCSLVLGVGVAWARLPMVDGDADGIRDEVDDCLYTPLGAAVDARGCSDEPDEDADGIADARDQCPYSPPGAQVDGAGCALDEDLDGVADGLDRCPGSAYAVTVDAAGCSVAQASVPMPLAAPPVTALSRPLPSPVPPGEATAAADLPAPPAPVASLPSPVEPSSEPPPTVLESAPPAAPPPVALQTPPSVPVPPPITAPVVTPPEARLRIRFATGSTDLDAAAEAQLQSLAAQLGTSPHPLQLGRVLNQAEGRLARVRAHERVRSVRNYLVALGVPAARLIDPPPGMQGESFSEASVTLQLQGGVPAPEARVAPRALEPATAAAPVEAPPPPAAAVTAMPAEPPVAPTAPAPSGSALAGLPSEAPPAAPPPPAVVTTVAASAPALATGPSEPGMADEAPAFQLPFEAASAQIGQRGRAALQAQVSALQALLAENPRRVLLAQGFGDAEREGDQAGRWSRARANSLRRVLIQLGLPADRIRTLGRGPVMAGSSRSSRGEILAVEE